MDEILPIAAGLVLGVLFASGFGWLRPWWIRTPLVVLAGVSATVTSGEFHANWAFVLVDVGEVALLAWMGFAGARAVLRRRELWTAPSSGTRPICGRSCARTRPITISTGLTAPCTQPRR